MARSTRPTPACCSRSSSTDGTAATDIEHIVARAEPYDSGLPEAEYRTFAGDLDNLTIAAPSVNRNEKSDRDAGDWMPEMNQGWFASTVVAVKQKYQLSVNPGERDGLGAMLGADSTRTVMCGTRTAAASVMTQGWLWLWTAVEDNSTANRDDTSKVSEKSLPQVLPADLRDSSRR